MRVPVQGSENVALATMDAGELESVAKQDREEGRDGGESQLGRCHIQFIRSFIEPFPPSQYGSRFS